MKTTLCLLGAATLFLASGCATRNQDRGGSYGTQESQRGADQSAKASTDRGYYWDENGTYHEYYHGQDRAFIFLNK